MVGSDAAEWMKIALPRTRPIHELDPELECTAGRGKKRILIQPKLLIEVPDRRNRRLSDPYRADRGRFDQLDAAAVPYRIDECRGRHPAGRASTRDDDAPNGTGVAHECSCGRAHPRLEWPSIHVSRTLSCSSASTRLAR